MSQSALTISSNGVEVAEALKAIADSARALCNGPLTMHALCLLIREELPRGYKSAINVNDVQQVLEAACRVDTAYVKKVKGAKP